MRIIFILILVVSLLSACSNQAALNADEKYYSQHYDKILKLLDDEHPERELVLSEYALVDIDGDGISELWVRDSTNINGAFFCRGGDELEIVEILYCMTTVRFMGSTVCLSGNGGFGEYFVQYVKLENSSVAYITHDLQFYDYETDSTEHYCQFNYDYLPYEKFQEIENALPEGVEPSADKWYPIERLVVGKD